jgi:hypothetical protein
LSLIEHVIFHGIGSYTAKNSIENTGLFMLVCHRVGVTGIHRKRLGLAGNDWYFSNARVPG